MSTTIKERPILFSAPMVRAIMEGKKTQTRRVVKHQSVKHLTTGMKMPRDFKSIGSFTPHLNACEARMGQFSLIIGLGACPCGVPGDRLWVKESWCQKFDDNDMPVYNAAGDLDTACCWYRATNPEVVMCAGLGLPDRKDGRERSPWRPSIHMPRRVSRILLEVVSVRVERLQSISEADAKAEGVDDIDGERIDSVRNVLAGYLSLTADKKHGGAHAQRHRAAFWHLWDSINGEGAWDSNPWVWVVEFKEIA